MKKLSYPSDYHFVYAEEVLSSESGHTPLRFPEKVIEGFQSELMQRIARFNTGIELQLNGNIKEVKFGIRMLDSDGFGVMAELYLANMKLLPNWKFEVDDKGIQQMSYQLDDHLVGRGPLRLLFPTHAYLEVVSVEVNDEAELRLGEAWTNASECDKPLRWLAHGDSITQGANVSVPSTTWVETCSRRCQLEAVNLGIGGFGMAEIEIAEYLASRQDADIISLNIGTNCINTKKPLADFEETMMRFVKTIVAAHPNKPVLLVSPIYRNLSFKDDQSFIQSYRDAMERVCQALVGEYPKLMYVNGLDVLGRDEGLLGDQLHISDAGAFIYAEHMTKVIKLALGM